MTMHPAERLLPSPGQLAYVESLSSSYLSDLDAIAASVQREAAGMTPAEFEQLRDAGLDGTIDETARFDESDLLELVRFAASTLQDAEAIREHAVALQRFALAALHDRRERS